MKAGMYAEIIEELCPECLEHGMTVTMAVELSEFDPELLEYRCPICEERYSQEELTEIYNPPK